MSPASLIAAEKLGVLSVALSLSCYALSGQQVGNSPEYALNSTAAIATQSAAVPASIVLPLEVLGANGTVVTTRFDIPDGPNLNRRLKLWLQIHALKYNTEASFQLNGRDWIPINSSTVSIQGLGEAFGGIGGGFSTLKMTLNLHVGDVRAGVNTLCFRFNETDGIRSGFRVLDFNIIASNGEPLIPAAAYTHDDPSKWQPPFKSAADIQAGKALWDKAPLNSPGFGPLRAKCGSCHAADGRDLKYFNYSNLSIRARSMFHGLTAKEGDQIASYIRTLDVPAPAGARPWNPPYQPGPGLDSRPVAEWAAGAGLSAVLERDADMQPYLLPKGSSAQWAAAKYLNMRELPIALQLPDWNSWLPQIHPLDAFPGTFPASAFNNDYSRLRGELHPGNAAAYQSAMGDIQDWMVASYTVFFSKLESPASWDAAMRQKLFSAALWQITKFWELNQEFGLEGMPQAIYASKADLRGWTGDMAFFTSPFMLHIPAGSGLGNGSVVSFEYSSFIWYQVQVILNDGQGAQSEHNPIDFPYVTGVLKDLSGRSNHSPQAMLLFAWLVKSLQEITQPSKGPEFGGVGWAPNYVPAVVLVHPGWQTVWTGTSPEQRATLSEDYLRVWIAQIASFTPQQYYQGKWASADEDPSAGNPLTSFGGYVWYMLPRFRYFGVDPKLTLQISRWATTLWPKGDWARNDAASCTGIDHCTSDR
jgi:cytochrome c553